jgi:flagellar basal-body rod protein FlgG
MIRSLWIAKTGLDAQQTQLDVISNNLANVSTNGFKRRARCSRTCSTRPCASPARSPRSRRRSLGAADRHRRAPDRHRAHLHPGQPAADRQSARHRDPGARASSRSRCRTAHLPTPATAPSSSTATGQIVTSSGYPLSPAITIPSNALSVTIGRDGVVRCCRACSTPTQVGTIQLASFVNNGGLQSMGENLFLETASSRHPTPNTPGTNGVGTAQPGLRRDLERQCGRGTGQR